MKWILMIIGAIAGVFLIRMLVLNDFEVIAWEIFWYEFFDGNLSGSGEEMKTIFSSNTFFKCATGFVAGGIAGFVLGRSLQKS